MKLRAEVVPLAEGTVLELGLGSGLNLAFYDPQRVTKVLGVDPGVALTDLAAARMAAAPVPVELLSISGEALPQADLSIDTVLTTFTLCTIPNVYAALREARRVLKPGGKLVFLEHGLAPEPAVARWQRRLNPLWGALAGGCQLIRDPRALLEDAGWHIEEAHHEVGYGMPGPRVLTYLYRGVARPLGRA
jgi:ubiquinone/menaquinone biosynthesis C-methylase UbiE